MGDLPRTGATAVGPQVRPLMRAVPSEAFGTAGTEVADHMDAYPADAVQAYAERPLRRRGTGWRLTGVRPEGGGRGGEMARLPVGRPARDVETARVGLARRVERARGAEAAGGG